MTEIRRAALYARVSTDDKGQDPDLQLRDLRRFAEARGWEAVEYTDFASAADLRGRKEWRRLMGDAARRRVDVVLVWKLDRAARSAYDAFAMLKNLEEHGVAFRAVDQPELDTTTSLGKAVFGIAAIFAELERSILRERVKAGMANAREKGVRIGRPSVQDDPKFRRAWSQVRRLILNGSMSRRRAAKTLGIGQATLKRLLDAESVEP